MTIHHLLGGVSVSEVNRPGHYSKLEDFYIFSYDGTQTSGGKNKKNSKTTGKRKYHWYKDDIAIYGIYCNIPQEKGESKLLFCYFLPLQERWRPVIPQSRLLYFKGKWKKNPYLVTFQSKKLFKCHQPVFFLESSLPLLRSTHNTHLYNRKNHLAYLHRNGIAASFRPRDELVLAELTKGPQAQTAVCSHIQKEFAPGCCEQHLHVIDKAGWVSPADFPPCLHSIAYKGLRLPSKQQLN